jgi:membrane protease YdiL (CAAX protease family)
VELAIKKNHNALLLAIWGILFALLSPCLPISCWENEFAGVGHLVGYEVIWWAMVAFVLSYVVWAEHRSLSSIGFRRLHIWDIIIAVLGAIVMIAGLAAIYFVLFPALHVNEDQQINQLVATPFWWRFISTIRAAVGEEVLFRGYAMERIEELIGSRAVAAVLSCTVFAVGHVGSWGWSHLLVAGFGGILLTVLYLWRRNLWVNIIAHFIVDGTAVLIG